MCGIVGILYKESDRTCNEKTLVSMRDIMVHRGPDDEGLFIDGNVGLGHRRLSIIDLATGHQPMSNQAETVWIVYNGEIYNYRSLRNNLIERGYIFRTQSDTEVIIHLYEEKGEECVQHLNGMFAFAIWDTRKRSLFLARDRMGIKPLYYADTPRAFIFASEIKAFFESGQISPQCNDEAVFEYFVFRQVAGKKTLFKGVYNLLPGHTLSVRNGSIRSTEYWNPFPKSINHNISFKDAAEELSYLLYDAVKIRLISDVPLGTFCSGGVDSSLTTAIAAKLVDHPINTFSVGFHETDYDESSFAREVSQQYGTRHHSIKLNAEEFFELLPRMIWHNDEPLNFANSIHMYAISKLAKSHVTVVLTGEGSDELFGGYPRYLIPRLASMYRKLPFSAQRVLELGSRMLGDHRVEKLRFYSLYSEEETLLYNAGFLNTSFPLDMATNSKRLNLEYRESNLKKSGAMSLDPLARLSLLDQQNYLVSILNRQDKMSMAASIESRVPMLDYRIVEFANTLPGEHKIRFARGKAIMKSVASKYLPRSIVRRRKSGFGVPLGRWMRNEQLVQGRLNNLVKNELLDDVFGKDVIRKFVDEHKSGVLDHCEFLWSALNIVIWIEKFGL